MESDPDNLQDLLDGGHGLGAGHADLRTGLSVHDPVRFPGHR